MLLVLLACMHRPPTTASSAEVPGDPSVSADPCTLLFDRGVALYNAGSTERAATTWTGGYTQCGPGHGFLAQQALAAAKLEHYDDAARLALQELSEPGPTPLALKLLIAMRLQVSTAVTSEVYARGRSPEGAIMVPDIQGEYAWIRLLLCSGREEALRQALVQGPHGSLDQMQFVCPGGGGPQTLYFDYSGDAMEQALQGEQHAPATGGGTGGE